MENRCVSCLRSSAEAVCPHCGYPEKQPNDSHQLPVGTMLRGRYRLGRVLGQGGFGITYIAWDELMQVPVAVKEFFPNGAVFRRSAQSFGVECITEAMVPHYLATKERFLREAKALVRFRDIPEVVDILDFAEENNTAYIVMEFVRGVDLAGYVRAKGGRLSVDETFRLLRPVMEALARVHQAGIIHRDISPDNILLDPMGGAKLLDFGAVRVVENPDLDRQLTKSTEAILKQGFAPLEQYHSRGSLGPWTDEYAMCATVWYCLTGKIPEAASTRVSEGIDPDWASIPGLSVQRQEALAKGFSPRARDRYPDMEHLLKALFPEEEAKPEPKEVEEKPDKTEEPIEEKKKGPEMALVFLLVALAVLLAVIEYGISESRKKTTSRAFETVQLLMEEGNYREALAELDAMELHPDQEQWALQCRYDLAQGLLEQGEFQLADAAFMALGDYLDSPEKMLDARYSLADRMYEEGNFADATAIFSDLRERGWLDSEQRWQQSAYLLAEQLYGQQRYAEAADFYEALGDYKSSPFRWMACRYSLAQSLLESPEGRIDYFRALEIFVSLDDFSDSRECAVRARTAIAGRNTVAAGASHSAAIFRDGTAGALGDISYGKCSVTAWTDLVSIAAGSEFTVGLRQDGTVVATGSDFSGETDVASWEGIIAISAGNLHTVGLRADGTVAFTGANSQGQGDVDHWEDIVAVSAGADITVGLRSDGTIAVTGAGSWEETRSWTEIVAISAGNGHIVALRADGTVVAAGENDAGQCDVGEWTEVIAICAGEKRTLAVHADGTVVAAGAGDWGRNDVQGWNEIVAVAAGYVHTLGLRADGTLVAAGRNDRGQAYVDNLSEIRLPEEQP